MAAGGAGQAARLDLAGAVAEGGEELGVGRRAALRLWREQDGFGRGRFQSTRPPRAGCLRGAGRGVVTDAMLQIKRRARRARRVLYLRWSKPTRRGSGRRWPSSVSWMPRPWMIRPTSAKRSFLERARNLRRGTESSRA